MNSVVHFEIPVDDMERAKKFYGSIFGWGLEDMSMPGMQYVVAHTTPVDDNQMPKEPGAINGGLMQRNPMTPAPVFAIMVDSVDDYIEKVKANGGTVVMPKKEIPDMGYYAYVKDSEGNVIGLWENLKK